MGERNKGVGKVVKRDLMLSISGCKVCNVRRLTKQWLKYATLICQIEMSMCQINFF